MPHAFLKFKLLPSDEPLIARMPKNRAEILRAGSEHTYKQLMEMFGLKDGTIRSRLHRARAELVALREQQAKDLAA